MKETLIFKRHSKGGIEVILPYETYKHSDKRVRLSAAIRKELDVLSVIHNMRPALRISVDYSINLPLLPPIR